MSPTELVFKPHSRINLLDCKRKKLYDKKLTKYQIAFSKTTKKASLIYQKLEKRHFSYLITKVRFQIRYVSEDKKKFSSIVSNFFPTQRKLLPVGVMRTDTL